MRKNNNKGKQSKVILIKNEISRPLHKGIIKCKYSLMLLYRAVHSYPCTKKSLASVLLKMYEEYYVFHAFIIFFGARNIF